ncbi:MAG: nitrilase family protein [Bacteroidales bacterium]|nr:nitrilase family protein [Bacteroidales bacterium]
MNQVPLRIAFIQLDIAWESPEENYRRVEAALSGLNQSVDVIVVPETFTTGFSDHMDVLSESPHGSTYQFAYRMAKQYEALFVGTWPVFDNLQNGIYNRMHLVSPDGECRIYDKAHTFRMSSEVSQLSRGRLREVFEWKGWRILPAVCYDLRFPKWLRNRFDGESLEYDLMLLCANWPVSRKDAWNTLLKARAIENLCYVLGVNRCGTDGNGIIYSGDSVALDYCGFPLAHCPEYKSSLQCVTFNAEKLVEFRHRWPFYLDAD